MKQRGFLQTSAMPLDWRLMAGAFDVLIDEVWILYGWQNWRGP